MTTCRLPTMSESVTSCVKMIDAVETPLRIVSGKGGGVNH